jgi:hypothetical protein
VRRCIAMFGCVLAGMTIAVGPAVADGGHQDGNNNLVVLSNSSPRNPASRSSTVTSRDVGDGPVNDTNLAYARSHDCTGCRTVAVAVQVVVIQGNPSNVQPQNGAVALNENCQSCLTFAYAHQCVITLNHRFEIDERTGEQLQGIQSNIDHVTRSGVDFTTMTVQLDQLSQQYYSTVQHATQNQGGSDGTGEHRQVQEHD